MPLLNDWIDGKLEEISGKLPELAHTEPASFCCGYNSGYKQAMLDLEAYLDKVSTIINSVTELYAKQHWNL